jgi:hypothetical protein
MNEIVVNLHMHTKYSDGFGTHAEIAQAALQSEVDVVIVTDHNVWVDGMENYYQDGNKRILMLIGEEVHDQARQPQKNHLLVFNANQEMAPKAYDPQLLIDSIKLAGGLSFFAHPFDPPAPAINEGDLSWVNWEVHGYTGIELWNAMTELKSLLKSRLHALYYVLNPKKIARGPFPETIKLWDELLAKGEKVVAIGGSDAHAFPKSMGPIHRTVFPYEFHFNAINTHTFVDTPLSGDLQEDKKSIFEALAKGHAFIGYDLPASTSGFSFTAHGKDQVAWMGDEISAQYGVTFQIHLPLITECLLYKNGKVLKSWHKFQNCTYITSEPGVYRVEAYIHYQGKRRGWIFSNPIYVRK